MGVLKRPYKVFWIISTNIERLEKVEREPSDSRVYIPFIITANELIQKSGQSLREVEEDIKELEARALIRTQTADDFLGRKYEIIRGLNYGASRDSLSLEGTKTGRSIRKIECVESDNNQFKLVVNEDYKNPLKCDKAKHCWSMVYRVAEDQSVEVDSHTKVSMDFINHNKRCKLYTQTGLNLTEIVTVEGESIIDKIPISMISDRTYITRLNKTT